MQLLFLWVKKCDYLQYNSGFTFSPEYNFEFLQTSGRNELKITPNKSYIINFYGKKISEITALVGENGSGKTTAAHVFAQYGGALQAIPKDEDLANREFIQVYKVNGRIRIYYFLSTNTLICNFPDIEKCCDVTKLNDPITKFLGFAKEDIQQNLTTVFISNVFNPDDLTARSKLSTFSVGQTYRHLAYTPSLCLKMSHSRKKWKYGQGYNGLVMNPFNEYADRMSNDNLRDYDDYQGELFIECYKSAPENIKVHLPIFKSYRIGVHQFGSYRYHNNTSEDKFDKAVDNIIRKLGVINDNNKQLFLQCYINVLCECDLFFGDISDTERSEIGKSIDNYVANGNYEINIELLKFITAEILKRNDTERDFRNLEWYMQLENSINVFKQNKNKTFLVGQHDFGTEDEILDFFLNEYKKDFSIFQKYLIFSPLPSSTGELALTNLFAYINDALLQKKCSNVLLIIDEIDAYLHPTWQQIFLKNLIDYLNEREETFQIIFTTHSPIILSDMTNDRIIKLKRESSEIVLISKCNNLTLGSNIEKLYYDDFFMKKGSIGEIAKFKISQVLNFINGNESISKEEVLYVIDNIAEPLIQMKLRRDFQNKFDGNNRFRKQINDILENIGYEKALEILNKYSNFGDQDDKH